MAEHILCDGAMRVVLGGTNDRALLFVKDGSAVRFWCDISDLDMALLGIPLELEELGGSCRVELHDNTVIIEFFSEEKSQHRCELPKHEFALALKEVRSSAR